MTYLQQTDATLEPFEGQFLVHGRGSKAEVVEGEFLGYLIIIEFPDFERARARCHSDACQKILLLVPAIPREVWF